MSLQTRNRFTRITTYVIFGLIILAFGLWGVADVFQPGTRIETVATVGEREITAVEFDNALRNEQRAMQQDASGRVGRAELVASGAVNQIMQFLVSRHLVDQLASDMQIVISDQEVLARIASEPRFQDSQGRFSQNRYLSAVRSVGLRPEMYEAAVREDLKRQYVFAATVAAAAMPEAAKDRVYDWVAERRKADYLEIPIDTAAALDAPSQSDLEAVYQDNISRFEIPETRAVTLLDLRPSQFADRAAVSDAAIEAYYEENKTQFGQAETRSWRQIIFGDEAAAQEALTALQEGGDFASVSESLGDQAPIAMQAQTQEALQSLLPALANAVFQAPANQAIVAETPLGWHVIEVTEIVPARIEPLADVRDAVREDLASAQAVEALVSLVNEVDRQLATGATLDEVAGTLNLSLRKIPAVDRSGRDRDGNPIADLPDRDRFLADAFASDTGVDSLLLEGNDGSYFAFRVDGVTPPAPRPLSEVEEEVTALWQAEQRREQAKKKADEIAEAINGGGSSLQAEAEKRGATIDSTDLVTRFETQADLTPVPELPPALFEAKKGEAVSVAGTAGAVVAVVTEIEAPNKAEDQARYNALSRSLNSSFDNEVREAFIAALQESYPVQIDQQGLEQALDQF